MPRRLSAAEKRKLRELRQTSLAAQAAAAPVVGRAPPKTTPPRGGPSSAAKEIADLGRDLQRKAKELKKQQRADAKSAAQQAKIFGGEQLVQPWEVPKTKKPKPPPKGETWAQLTTRKRQEAQAAQEAWRQRNVRQAIQLLAAETAPISSRSRRVLGELATPERQEQMRHRPVPAQAQPSALQKDWKKFWSGDFVTSAEGAIGGAAHLVQKGVREQGKLWGPIIHDLYEATFDADDRRHLAQLQADAMQTGMEGGELVGNALGNRAHKTIARDLQSAGLTPEFANQAAGVVDNFLTNVSKGVIGLGPGAVAIGTHPIEMGEEIAAFYKYVYEPLYRGDFDEFRKRLAENPDMTLDWLGALGVATGIARRAGVASRAAAAAETVGATRGAAAVKGALTGKEPVALPKLDAEGNLVRDDLGDIPVEYVWGRRVPTATIRAREGRFGPVVDTGVQQYVAKGPVARAAGRGWDFVADVVTPSRSRKVRKGLKDAAEANRARTFASIEGFRKAARRVEKDPAQAKAFDRMLLYGGDAAKVVNDITQELGQRAKRGLTETPAQQDEILRLNEAAAYLSNPSDDFLAVVDEGRRIANETEQHLIDAGFLSEKTAERMKLIPAKFLEDVPAVASPFRDHIVQTLRNDENLQWSDEDISAALQWLDANAVAWARREGAPDPGAFYEALYKDFQGAKTEDLANMMDQAENVLAQYRKEGESVPMAFDERNAEVALHQKANRELQAGDPAALERAMPKLNHPAKKVATHEEQLAAIEAGGEQFMREVSRWYADIWPEFTRMFGADGERAVRSFLMSQVAMSPQDGVLAMLKVLEYKQIHGEWPEGGMLSHRTAEIVNAWVNDHLGVNPSGIAAKIADFFGSAYGQETRAWLNGEGGAPGVVDRWTLRSLGFWDENSYAFLRSQGIEAPNPKVLDDTNKRIKQLEDKKARSRREERELTQLSAQAKELRAELNEFYDISSGPDAYQYEWGNIRLNELRELANTSGLFNKTDWTIDEIQAMDWFATRARWGEAGGGWGDTWARNTYNVIGEITGDMRKEWLEEGARGAIIQGEATTNGSHGHVTLLGTPTQAEAMARRLSQETGRRSYMFYDFGVSPLHRGKSPLRPREAKTLTRKRGIDVEGDPDMVMAVLRDRMDSYMEDGLLVLPYGDGRVRVMFTDVDGKTKRQKRYSAQARDDLVNEFTARGVVARPVDAIMDVVHARQKPAHSLYRGDDARGVLARAAAARRRRTGFHVSEIHSEAEAGRFLDGLARNTRGGYLSPRTAEYLTSGEYRAWLTHDGNAGGMVGPEGDIVNLFNSSSVKGAGGQVLVEALANGGYWLDCYDGFLPAYYANLGFREVARLKFAEEYAPPGWTYKDGRPDVVYMAYAPHMPIKRAPYFKSDEAATAATQKLGKEGLAQRSVDSLLEEYADRGDGLAHIDANGETLAQWKRTVKFDEGDPVVAGLVRITDDGVEMHLSNAANFSTLVHENAHAMMRGTLEWLRQGNDPRLLEIQHGLGIFDINAPYPVASQELFARLVETRAYLNNAPAPQVRRMLTSSNKLMREAYKGGIRTIGDTPAQKAKIEELLQSDAFSSLLDEMIDVTYGTTRSADAVFIPRLPPTAPSKIVHTIQRITGRQTRAAITPPRKGPVAKGRSEYKRFESGEYRYGPDVVADYATATFRWELGRDLGREIHQSPFAKDIELDVDGAPVFLEGHVPFVYQNIPGAMRRLDQALGMAEQEIDVRALRHGDEVEEPADFVYDMEPHEAAEVIRETVTDILRQDVLPRSLNRFDPYVLEEMLGTRAIVQIPKKIAEDYFDAVSGGTLMSMGAKHISRDFGPWAKAGLVPLAVLNFFQRWSMIGKGAYVTTNTVGAMLTATAHNPFWVGEIKKAADFASSWSPQALHIVDEMVGSGTFDIAQLLDEARKAEMSLLQRISQGERHAYVKTVEAISLPERRIRRALALRELHAAGITTEARFMALVEAARVDDKWRMFFNQIARHAEDGAIRFRGMSEAEHAIIRRAFFVYGWLRASLRYTMRFPLEHPIQAAIMNRVGNEGWDLLQERLEQEIGLRGGIVTELGDKIARMIDISTVLPQGAGTQTARALAAVPLSLLGHEKKDWDTISDMFTPGIEAGLTFAMGETTRGLTLTDLVEGYGKGKGFAGVPGLSWIMRMADPSYTETTTFAKSNRLDVAMSFLFGQLWPRGTKLDAAHEIWLKNQPKTISAPIKAQAELDDLLNKYSQANRMSGEAEDSEWTLAAQAHAAYDLTSDLKTSDWNDLPKKERDLKRSVVRARVLEKFYPGAWDDLLADGYVVLDPKTKKITGIDAGTVDDEYTYWVTNSWSDLRSYIRDELGEDVFDAEEE